MHKYKILALGDCNIIGANNYDGVRYIDLVAKKLNITCKNCGITMSTTKEGLILFNENKHHFNQIVVIAYGLVDSWKTFKYSPYVLYYPDNFLRNFARHIVKKYKKICRKYGLNNIFGQKYSIHPDEYKKNIETMILNSYKSILIETPPHLTETFRNKDIKKYNKILEDLSKKYNNNCSLVKIYDEFLKNKSLYLDNIHFNEKGNKLVAKKILEQIMI